jgi:poly-gamma-glutamate system protein
MKQVYWRPRNISQSVHILIAGVSVLGLLAVEFLKIETRQDFYNEKMDAARLAQRAMEVIKLERTQMDPADAIDLTADPTESGLIGVLMSPVTSNTGRLAAKQTSINPNFAAVVVHYLKRLGVQPGDVVAVGASGSFPAVNICVYAALATLQVEPIVISSTAASQWGANRPNLLWIDMERILCEERVFEFHSVAASVGGIEDNAIGMSAEGRKMLADAIERNGIDFIRPKNYADSVEKRMAIYRDRADKKPIKAYISIGGGTSSVGTKVGKEMFRPGINSHIPLGAMDIDSVMARFLRENIKVVHLIKMDELATRFGFPLQPQTMPSLGHGTVFVKRQYNTLLAIGALSAILLCLIAFIRSEWGYLILRNLPKSKKAGHIEPSV